LAPGTARAASLDGVDAVAVATLPHTHAPIVRAAVAAGKHVVCENPRATPPRGGRCGGGRGRRVVHLLGTEFRFAPAQALAARRRPRAPSGRRGPPRVPAGTARSHGSTAPSHWLRRIAPRWLWPRGGFADKVTT
jgi:predicted dehydrogenase